MTAEQFAAEYEALQKQKREIESKQKALREAYVDTLPFKVGDCISIDSKYRPVPKAWITKITADPISPHVVNVWFCRPKKDGTKSIRIEHEPYIRIEEIQVINDTL